MKILTWKDSACPYFALILGSRMVARLVPLTVNRVPPLQRHKTQVGKLSHLIDLCLYYLIFHKLNISYIKSCYSYNKAAVFFQWFTILGSISWKVNSCSKPLPVSFPCVAVQLLD